jgi:hypothetical protein
MELPTIPTDNLYKFLTVFGILVAIASLLIPRYVHNQMRVQVLRADTELREAQARSDAIHRVNQAQNNQMNYVELTTQLEGIQPAIARAEGRKQEAESQEVQASRLVATSNVGVAVGIALATLGFVLWYLNLQRWQDQAVKREARSQAGRGE